MPLNRNTLMRIRTIDACLQRRHRKWTLNDLHEACEDALYEMEGIDGISVRTIQRDIELMRSGKLGYVAPIVVRERKFYEYEDPDFSITGLPLSEKDIAELNSALDIIKHYSGFAGMSGQNDVLARMQDSIRTQENHKQVVFIETNSQLRGLHLLGELYNYIIRKQPIKIEYKSFKSIKSAWYNISPYLLKEYNNRWFLFGYSKKKGIINIALDRIISLSDNKETPFIENTFFDSETYLDDMVGVTRSLNSRKERVTLWIDSNQAPYIITKPIHKSQQVIREQEDGSITITLDIIINLELERVILGYGSHIEVLSPYLLRHRISNSILRSAARYTK